MRVRGQWYMFEVASLTDYARRCHAVFALALVPWCILALAVLIIIMLGIWRLAMELVNCIGGKKSHQLSERLHSDDTKRERESMDVWRHGVA